LKPAHSPLSPLPPLPRPAPPPDNTSAECLHPVVRAAFAALDRASVFEQRRFADSLPGSALSIATVIVEAYDPFALPLPPHVSVTPRTTDVERKVLNAEGWGNLQRCLRFVIIFSVYETVQQVVEWTFKGLQKTKETPYFIKQIILDMGRTFKLMLLRGDFVRRFELMVAGNSVHTNYNKVLDWHRQHCAFFAGGYTRSIMIELKYRFSQNIIQEAYEYVFNVFVMILTDAYEPLHQWFHSHIIFSNDNDFTGTVCCCIVCTCICMYLLKHTRTLCSSTLCL
jgi:hypothetical protein